MDFKLSQAGGYELRPKMAEIEGFAESGRRFGSAWQWCVEQRMRSILKTQIESSRCYRCGDKHAACETSPLRPSCSSNREGALCASQAPRPRNGTSPFQTRANAVRSSTVNSHWIQICSAAGPTGGPVIAASCCG